MRTLLAALALLPLPALAQEHTGLWVPYDVDATIIRLQSDQAVPGEGNAAPRPAYTLVACFDGAIAVAFAFNGRELSGSAGFGDLTFSFDGGNEKVIHASNRPTGRYQLDVEGTDAGLLIDSMLSSRTMRVGVTPPDAARIEVDFRVKGLALAIPTVRDACK